MDNDGDAEHEEADGDGDGNIAFLENLLTNLDAACSTSNSQ